MNDFALFILVPLALSATATAAERPLHALPEAPIMRQYESRKETFKGPDRTITWRPWQQSPEGDFRFRIGDRYLGHGEYGTLPGL